MNKLFQFLTLASMGGLMLFAACGDDDSAGPGNPTVTVTPPTADVAPGKDITFTVTATAKGSNTITTVTADDGSGAVAVNGGTYTYSIDVAAVIGSDISITFIATDDAGNSGNTTAVITVSDKTIVTITDADLAASTTYNWIKENVYLLDGLVYLEAGGVLNIEAGTVIKAKTNPTGADNTSSLIITRDATINANGTSTEPIIFTAEDDDLDGGLTDIDVSLWGGVILLGNASVEKDGNTEVQIEGIDSGETRGLYGGTDDGDSSGSMTYCSIRHSGVGLAPGDEIQGLTLGAVGSGTTLNYIEIFASADDGIEFFGGTVRVNHAVIAFAEDDSFDWDTGYRGGGQYWFVIQKAGDGLANHGGEWDGAVPDGATLYSNPTVYNATFIGSGVTSTNPKNSPAILMRDNTAGTIGNSIFTDFNGKGMEVEDLATAKGADAYDRIGVELFLKSNVWFVGGHTTVDATATGVIQVTVDDLGAPVGDDPTGQLLANHLTSENNQIFDPVLVGISRTTDGGLDPRPTAGGIGTNLATVPAGFDVVNYHGAVDPNATTLWMAGWTALSEKGYLAE